MRDRVLEILARVAAGEASPQAALDRLAWLPVEAVGQGENGDAAFARLDHHRALRQGHPEVVFGPGKTPEQLVEIGRRFARRGDGFLVTRLDERGIGALRDAFPDGEANRVARTFHEPARGPVAAAGGAGAAAETGAEAAERERQGPPRTRGPVLVVTGGTGDVPVAEEAAVTAAAFGNPTERLYDVGVAGIHRVLGEGDTLRRAAVVIVVAGMEGALPSVVGGLVGTPVIAVPTSVGYGAAFGGLAPLLGMLNSCAAGVTVVNIDNGFGAAVAATRINQLTGADGGRDSHPDSDPDPSSGR